MSSTFLKQRSLGSDTTEVSQLDTRSLADQVGEILYTRIITGVITPGERINEADLARSLGISRNPIREAIRRLEERGILVSAPRRGTFVRKINPVDIDDTCRFRVLVESFAIRNALPQMTDKELAELESIIDRMVEAANVERAPDVIELDVMFHRRICELSQSRWALRTFNDLYAEVRMIMVISEQYFESLIDSSKAHYKVIRALRTRDLDKAIAAMSAHIEDPWQRIVAHYERPRARGPKEGSNKPNSRSSRS